MHKHMHCLRSLCECVCVTTDLIEFLLWKWKHQEAIAIQAEQNSFLYLLGRVTKTVDQPSSTNDDNAVDNNNNKNYTRI